MGIFDFTFGFSKSSGGGTNVPLTKELMQFQSDQWRSNTEWFNKNGYKYLRDGLIAADYNPILAIGSSPLDGTMPNATAVDGTRSSSFNYDGAATAQASTARKLSDSQILVNKNTADKIAEETKTQENVRNNLDSQSLLNLLQSEEIRRLLPFKERKLLADILVADSTARLNNTTAEYIPQDSESKRIVANANSKNAETNAQWTPAKVVAGALGGLSGYALGKFGKFKKLGGVKKLGKNGYLSSSAEYFTTLH